MKAESFELKILKPYLDNIEQPRFPQCKIELVDGSRYFLTDRQNEVFQKYMVESAYKYLK